MRKGITIVAAAAAMAVGSVGFISTARADDPNAPGNQTENRATVDVTSGKQQSPAADDVRDVVSEAVSASVQGKFEDAAKRFTDADRTRLGDNFKDSTALHDQFTQFQTDWRAKYNQDFDSANIKKALSDPSVSVYQGDYTDRARMASERMRPENGRTDVNNPNNNATPGTPNADNSSPNAGENHSGAFSKDNQPRGTAENTTADHNQTALAGTDRDNKDIATLHFGAAGDMQATNLALRKESGIGNTWKIDLPDSTTAQALSDSLTKHVKMVTDQKDSWPADVNEAYRSVTRHVLMGLSEAGGMGAMDHTGTPRDINSPATPQTNSPR